MKTPRVKTLPIIGAALSAAVLTTATSSAFLFEDGTFETPPSSFADGVGWETFGVPDNNTAVGIEDWANGAPGTGGGTGYGAIGDGQFGMVFKGYQATSGGFYHDVPVDPSRTYDFHIQSHVADNMYDALDLGVSSLLEINFDWYDGDPTGSGTLISGISNDLIPTMFPGGSDGDPIPGPTDSFNWDDWDFTGLTPPVGAAYLRVTIQWATDAIVAGGDDVVRWDNAQLTTSLDPTNDSTGSGTFPRVRHTTQAGLDYTIQFSKDLQNFVNAGFPVFTGTGSDNTVSFAFDGPCGFWRADGVAAPNDSNPDRRVRPAGLAGGDADWQGFMNVSELDANGGAFVFGSPWGVADLVSDILTTTNTVGSQLTLTPNTIGDPNQFWYQNTTGMAPDPTNPGGPGQMGNKKMEANLFYTYTNSPLSGQNVMFSGNVASNSLTSAHVAEAFIKDFAPDFSSFTESRVALAPGPFSISLATDPGADRHIQFGFSMLGENVWVTDVGPFGSVVIDIDPVIFTDDDITIEEGPASTITWDGQNGVYYVAEYSDDAGSNWFPLLTTQTLGSGAPLTVVDPSGVVGGRIYRAVAAPAVPLVPAP